ncbi:MAG: hypothetical protein ACRERC_00825, partial [Candidatus Binatia bacterium]
YLVWTVWVAIGAPVFCRALDRASPVSVSPSVLLFLLAAGTLALNFDKVDLSADTSARQRGEEILAALEPQAVYLGTWADVPILEYLQIVEGRRPDVHTVNLVFVARRGANIAGDWLRAGRSVYTSAPGFLKGDASPLVADQVDACGCFRLRFATAEDASTAAGSASTLLPAKR